MPFEPAGAVALLFPGQGAQTITMLEPFRAASGFAAHLAVVSDLLGGDPLAADETSLNQNKTSSLLTVAASLCALELWRARAGAAPRAVAGYSVGQLTALYAANVLEAPALLTLVARRADLMDRAIDSARPSGMLAVIGPDLPKVEAICAEAQAAGLLLAITNYNAPGQLTLGGELAGLDFAERRLAALRPRRLRRVPAAGAWHSAVLEPAVDGLADLLATVEFRPAAVPVIDNVTGGWLPDPIAEAAAFRRAVARQVAAPVRWADGVRTLKAAGVRRCVEIGYSDLLTKFGFFVDRELVHEAVSPPPRGR